MLLFMARLDGSVIEPVGSDLVALALAHALDATIFPHQSLPAVYAGTPPALWIARAEAGGPVVGFVATQVQGGTMAINGIGVGSSHRRAGLGRALLRAAIHSALERELSFVMLHVSTGNHEAISLYVSEGFRKAERLRGFYRARHFPDGGNAWRMIRSMR